jgi:hypothetical protein
MDGVCLLSEINPLAKENVTGAIVFGTQLAVPPASGARRV